VDSRRRKLRRFSITLGTVAAAYALYATLAVPSIERPVPRRAPTGASTFDPDRFKADWVAWLPADAWERGSCKQLSTRNGHLFYRDSQAHDDGRIELKPLTIILPLADDREFPQPPLILRAPEGAVLKLDRPLSVGGEPVQLESGQILGQVTMSRPATRPEASDDWQIETSQIHLFNDRIQTLQAVDFRFGPHFGRGRNLNIKLQVDPLRSSQRTMSGVRGIERIELATIEQLHLVPQTTPVADGVSTESAEDPTLRYRSATIDYPNGFDVTCGGPFDLVAAAGLATLHDNVKIVSCDRPDDWLAADSIELQLAATAPANLSAPPGQLLEPALRRPTGSASSNWGLRSIAAIGRPAVLSAASRDLRIQGQSLVYHMADLAIEASDSEGVNMRQANIEVVARHLLYRISADGSLGSGSLTGPGVLRRGATAQQQPFEIAWRENLQLLAQDGRKSIWLTGGSRLDVNGQSKLMADELRIWLWELPAATEPPPSTAKWTWHLDRFVAAGNVHFESPRLDGWLDEFDARWPQPAVSKPSTSSPRSGGIASAAIQSAPTSPLNHTVLPQTPESPPPPKIALRANLATAEMNAEGADSFRELVVEGNVHVNQVAGESEAGLDITGQKLRIAPQPNQKFALSVHGQGNQPGRIAMNSLVLFGQTVNLDQYVNRLWIDGPGQLEAERASLAGGERATAAADPAAHGETTIEVRWAGGMVFNGQHVYFETDVQTSAQQSTGAEISHVETRSAAASLSLQSPIDLSGQTTAAATTPSESTQIELITLIGRIAPDDCVFAARPVNGSESVELVRQVFDKERQLVGLQRVSVPWGQIDAISGELKMTGPGLVSLWRMTAGLGSERNANEAIAPRRLTNTSIAYQDAIHGNLRQSDLLFSGKVRTVHGPVADWQTAADFDRGSALGDSVRLRSDQLQVSQWKPEGAESAHVEIIALGQAHAEGESFDADAERISYHQAQEKIVLAGDPRNGARLTYQTAPGGPRNPLVASKIAYNLRDHTIQVDGFKHGVLTTGPLAPRR
jgi:hypothetical protein